MTPPGFWRSRGRPAAPPGRAGTGAAAPGRSPGGAAWSAVSTAAGSTDARSRGLNEAERGHFESRFGRDFSNVRIHTGGAADRAARGMGALAFALGEDIGFKDGAFDPGTEDGQRLIAHELAHVVQHQDGRAPDRVMRQGDPMAVDKMSPATSRDPAKVTQVDYVVVSCVDQSIRFYTDQGIFPYGLTTKGTIPTGVFEATVAVTGNKVEFTFAEEAEEEGEFDFGWKIEKGKENPATFFKSQSTVRFIFRGDKTGTEIPDDIANAEISRHIDNAATITYDSNYKSSGFGMSPWLQVKYADGTKIDIHLDQIEDEMLVGNEVLTAHKQSFIGEGGRITPIRINRQTAPNLFAAKHRAIEEQTKATNDLILGSIPAILFIISLGSTAAIVGKPPSSGGGPKPLGGGKPLAQMTNRQMGKFVQGVYNSRSLLRRLANARALEGKALEKELQSILSAFQNESGITVQRVAKGVVEKARGPGNQASLRSNPGFLQIEEQVFQNTASLYKELVHELCFYYARLDGKGVVPALTNGALNAMQFLEMMVTSGGKLPSVLK